MIRALLFLISGFALVSTASAEIVKDKDYLSCMKALDKELTTIAKEKQKAFTSSRAVISVDHLKDVEAKIDELESLRRQILLGKIDANEQDCKMIEHQAKLVSSAMVEIRKTGSHTKK